MSRLHIHIEPKPTCEQKQQLQKTQIKVVDKLLFSLRK